MIGAAADPFGVSGERDSGLFRPLRGQAGVCGCPKILRVWMPQNPGCFATAASSAADPSCVDAPKSRLLRVWMPQNPGCFATAASSAADPSNHRPAQNAKVSGSVHIFVRSTPRSSQAFFCLGVGGLTTAKFLDPSRKTDSSTRPARCAVNARPLDRPRRTESGPGFCRPRAVELGSLQKIPGWIAVPPGGSANEAGKLNRRLPLSSCCASSFYISTEL